LRRTVTTQLLAERNRIESLNRRPVLARPMQWLQPRRADVDQLAARLRAMSPQATLDRGYAIVHTQAGAVVESIEEVHHGNELTIRIRDGQFEAAVTTKGSQ